MFLGISSMKNNGPNFAMYSHQERSLFPVLPADKILTHVHIQKILKQIEARAKMEEKFYRETYAALISRFAEYVQIIPVIEKGILGGMFIEGLRRADLAMQLQLESNVGEDDPLLTFAVFSAALLVDMRKLLVNKRIIISDLEGAFIKEWLPFEGPLTELGDYYKIRTYQRSLLEVSPYISIVLAQQVMPRAAFLWLAENTRLFNMWLAALCGDEEGGGSVGHFLNLSKMRMQEKEPPTKMAIPVEIMQPEQTNLGEAFWAWLRNLIDERAINNPENHIYLVEKGIFVEIPQLVQKFSAEKKLDWQAVLKQFLALNIAIVPEPLDKNNPNQLFVYLNREEINPAIKNKTEAKTARNFFSKPVEPGSAKEQENMQASYRKYGLLLVEEWFFNLAKDKKDLKIMLKELLTKEKSSGKYATLNSFITQETKPMSDHYFSKNK